MTPEQQSTKADRPAARTERLDARQFVAACDDGNKFRELP